MDDLQTKGFLSPAIAEQRQYARQQYAPDFERCENASERAVALISATRIGGMLVPTLFASCYWVKCVRACQAGILLAEHGMMPDAQTQLRTAVESLFYAVALVNQPDLLDRLEEHDVIERMKQAGGMLRVATIMQHVADDTRAQLEALEAGDGVKRRVFSAYDAAEAAGMLELYQTLYRGFSRGAAHSTIKALEHELFAEPDGSLLLNFGPCYDALPETLDMIGVCLRAGVDALTGRLVSFTG